ncbi:MAG: HAD-IIA family hydrolase [Bacteroidota bacterium]
MQYPDFRSIAARYKVIFFDSYGVLKNHEGIIPGVKGLLQWLTDQGVAFYVLTNDASRSPRRLAKYYQDAGSWMISKDKIISSGMLARDYLERKVNNGTVAYLGTEQSAHYVEKIGLKTVSIGDLDLNHIDSINALVLLDDEGFQWDSDINKAINLLRKRNMPVIMANTDTTYPVSRTRVNLAIGAIGDLIETVVDKNFLRFGKPDAEMFNFAYSHIQTEHPVAKKDILMVGDTLRTDIIGGNKFGIDTCLVLTGNTQARYAKRDIERRGIIPDYICETVGTPSQS